MHLWWPEEGVSFGLNDLHNTLAVTLQSLKLHFLQLELLYLDAGEAAP